MKIYLNHYDTRHLINDLTIGAILTPRCPSMEESSLKIAYPDNLEGWYKITKIEKCRLDELTKEQVAKLGFACSELVFTYDDKKADPQKLYYYIEFDKPNNVCFRPSILNDEYTNG